MSDYPTPEIADPDNPAVIKAERDSCYEQYAELSRTLEEMQEACAERVRYALDAAAKVCEDYGEWSPQWGEHRNQAVADQAALDCAKRIREMKP